MSRQTRGADRLTVRDGEVDTAVVAEYESSRRDLVRRGMAAGGAVVAAASIPGLLRVRSAFAAQAEGDAAILASAVGLEQISVFAYQASIDSRLLDAPTTRTAARFRDQEQEHAEGLSAALRALGGSVPAEPTRIQDVDRQVTGLGDVRNQRDVMMFAIELETAAVAAYYDAHQKLQDPKLLRTAASIMANEGQHLVALRSSIGLAPVPNAFETGKA